MTVSIAFAVVGAAHALGLLVPGSMAWVNRWRSLLRWPLGVAVVLAMLAAPMFDALALAKQARPGDGLKVGPDAPHHDFSAIELLAERLQARHRFAFEPTVGQFLDPVRKPALECKALRHRNFHHEDDMGT